MSLGELDDGTEWRHIAPEARTFWTIGALCAVALPTVPLIVLGLIEDVFPLAALGAVIFAAGAIIGRHVVLRRWRSWGYAERDTDLLIRRGVLFRRFTVVPYGRMQFVDVTQGPIDRLLGLATVRLHTAAAASDAVIPLLSTRDADRLRDRLVALGEIRAAGL